MGAEAKIDIRNRERKKKKKKEIKPVCTCRHTDTHVYMHMMSSLAEACSELWFLERHRAVALKILFWFSLEVPFVNHDGLK